MFSHYLSAAARHFRRHKLTTAINVACLALGLICFISALAIAQYFSRSDQHHRNAERIHAITERIYVPGSDISYPAMPNTAWPVAQYLKSDFPQLEAVARASMGREIPVAADGRNAFMQASFADPEIFQIFDFEFVAGNARAALREPRSAVVSEDFAVRLFGTRDVVGKSLLLNNSETVFIRGVLARMRRPSHISMEGQPASLYFEALVSMDVHERLRAAGLPPEVEQVRFGQVTGALNYYAYVLLPKDGSLTAAAFGRALKAFGTRHAPQGPARAEFDVLHVSGIPGQHMDMMTGTDEAGISSTSLLVALGLMVLLVSCLNYANLTAAQADTRTKEVAVRRIIGAPRLEVIAQHAAEALLLTALALGLSLIALAGLMLASGPMMQTALRLVLIGAPAFWGLLFVVLVVVSAVTSSYPGFILSRVKPAQGMRMGRSKTSSPFMSKALVGTQFAAASFLLILVLVMHDQNDAMRKAGMAAAGDQIVLIANDVKAANVDMELLRSELAQLPGVQSISASMTPPLSLNGNSYGTIAGAADQFAQKLPVVQQYVDYDFFETLQMRLIAGRGFERNRGVDVADASREGQEQTIIIDDALAERFGWPDPRQAIGKILYLPAFSGDSPAPAPVRVIGVVESRSLTLLGLGAGGATYQLAPQVAQAPLIRISASDIAASLAGIDAVWSRLAPNIALKRRFLDEHFEQNYRIFIRVTNAFGSLAILSFLIAGMGLVGMAIHVASRRTHEIGVRKTLGASVLQILAMLLKDFSKPIVVANLAAWPLAFLAAYAYLGVFVHRTALTPVPFLFSLTITLSVAWLAVVAQATRAARLKPATVLRYE